MKLIYKRTHSKYPSYLGELKLIDSDGSEVLSTATKEPIFTPDNRERNELLVGDCEVTVRHCDINCPVDLKIYCFALEDRTWLSLRSFDDPVFEGILQINKIDLLTIRDYIKDLEISIPMEVENLSSIYVDTFEED